MSSMNGHGRALLFLPLLVGLTLAMLAGCADVVSENVRGMKATVVAEDGRYVLVSDSTGTRYIPEHMPRPFKQDGLKVFVRGRAGESVAGTNGAVPIELTSLALRPEE